MAHLLLGAEAGLQQTEKKRLSTLVHQTDSELRDEDWPELLQNDPLADSVVEDSRSASHEVRALLLQGMMLGCKSIPNAPSSYRLFLEEVESVLCTAPSTGLASEAYLLARPVWISMALGPGALVHTYSDPAIARTLAHTGQLLDDAATRRLAENNYWNLQLIREGAWTTGGPAYVHTLQVRLMHARVRLALQGKIPREDLAGESMNQRRMVRTWLDFSTVGPLALARLGIDWTEEEKQAVSQLWQLVGRLLGIPERLMISLSKPGMPEIWLNFLDQGNVIPTEEALHLTRSMLEALGKRMSVVLKLPPLVSHGLMQAFVRHIHGDSLADAMGVAQSDVASLVPFFVDANRYRVQQIRSNEQIKNKQLQQARMEIEAIVASFPGRAAYQSN